MDTTASTVPLQAELRHLRDAPGIGLVDWVFRKQPGLPDAALAAQPSLLSVSFGADLSLVGWAPDAGVATILRKARIAPAPEAISRAWIWPGIGEPGRVGAYKCLRPTVSTAHFGNTGSGLPKSQRKLPPSATKSRTDFASG